MNGWRRYSTYIQCNTTQLLKEWNNAICSNMNATRDYYTKWSKSEKQISYAITYMWNLKHGTIEPI